jgi:hypothetical protein
MMHELIDFIGSQITLNFNLTIIVNIWFIIFISAHNLQEATCLEWTHMLTCTWIVCEIWKQDQVGLPRQ